MTKQQFSDEELRQRLTPEQYRVLREHGTEAPGTGQLLYNEEKGEYRCPVCHSLLFTSDAKYESTMPGLIGWPSFSEAASNDALELAGFCYLQAGDVAAARRALRQAIDADRRKADSLLSEAEKQLADNHLAKVQVLLDIYQQQLPATARSLALHLRFAALQGDAADVSRYGDQLARRFPQSIQYQRYLANEY